MSLSHNEPRAATMKDTPPTGEEPVVATVTDINARLPTQRSLLRATETLLVESHHRVKNNLQIVASLLMLQSDHMATDEARSALQQSACRMRSIALIHQQLHGSESLERIDLGDYAQHLTVSLQRVFTPRAQVRVRAVSVEVTAALAVPIGLILNELITNAFKHGVPDPTAIPASLHQSGPPCEILIEIDADDECLRLAVTDSGPGLPEDFDLATAPSLGLQLVHSLIRQLRGHLTVKRTGGTRFELLCPRPRAS